MLAPSMPPADFADQAGPRTPWGPVVARLIPVLILLTAGIGTLIVWARRQVEAARQHPAVGKLIELDLRPIGGDPQVGDGPLPTLQGKVSLVHMWGPWCDMCRMELPFIIDLARMHQHNDEFQVLSIAYPPEPVPDTTLLERESRATLLTMDAPFPAYLDRTGVTYRQINAICDRNFIFPTTFVVGRDGRVTAFWQGYVPGMEDRISDAIDKALAAGRRRR